MTVIRRDGPEPTGSSTPKPLDERFDYCVSCTVALEPTRRAGGVCGPCMRKRMAARPALDAASSSAAEGRHQRRAGVSLAYGKGKPLRLVKR